MYDVRHNFIIGFHGCEESTRDKLISRPNDLVYSNSIQQEVFLQKEDQLLMVLVFLKKVIFRSVFATRIASKDFSLNQNMPGTTSS